MLENVEQLGWLPDNTILYAGIMDSSVVLDAKVHVARLQPMGEQVAVTDLAAWPVEAPDRPDIVDMATPTRA